MDLLETILRTAKSEKYFELFKNEGLTANNLKLLTSEDLRMIGVDSEECRKNILNEAENLIITSEKRTNTTIDLEYANAVLVHVPNILKLHYSNLYNALTRPQILNCEMQMEPAMDALLVAINNLKSEIKSVKDSAANKKKNGKKKINPKKAFAISAAIGILLCTNFIYFRKFKY